MNLLRRLVFLTIILSGLLGSGLFVSSAHAQTNDVAGLAGVNDVVKLTSTDPRILAARIINAAMGVLGIILVSIIIYAGFLYMTSGGDPEKTTKAKLWIRNAIIGLIIILSAWAITTFIINKLIEATGGGGGGGSDNGSGGGLGGGGASSVFQVQSMTPVGVLAIRNIEVRFLFTRPVNETIAKTAIKILRASDQQPVEGTVTVAGTLVTFQPSAACPEPNADRKCLEKDTDYVAQVSGSLRSVGGQTIACGGFAPKCTGTFKTGSLVDTKGPSLQITSPLDGQSVSVDDVIRVSTRATDDSGVSYVETFADAKSFGKDGPTATSSALEFEAITNWITDGVPFGVHALTAEGFDIDSNQGKSGSVSLAVRPAHCFNGKQDDDETGLDCGGAGCGICSGGSCKVNSDCMSGVCLSGKCVEQPIITAISPGDGRAGTFVTISGVNFGAVQGKVFFAGGKEALPPQACAGTGMQTWSQTQAIVQVPEGAKSGPVQIVNTAANLSDATDDNRGLKLKDYLVNDLARPGLCGAKPNHGEVGTLMSLIGGGLGTSAGTVAFDERLISSFGSWSDMAVDFNVPVYSPALYAAHVTTNGIDSNNVAFRIDEKQSLGVPTIDRVDPENGAPGTYVTIVGRNLGASVGKVYFQDPISGEKGSADISFPSVCPANFWKDDSVVVKVPKTIGSLNTIEVKPGEYQITVTRSDNVPTNAVAFAVDNSPLAPGVCAIQPSVGPAGTGIKILGERFGSKIGSVEFKSAQATVKANVLPTNWAGDKIETTVPKGASSGLVRVTAATSSNGVPFEVQNCKDKPGICGKEEICCPTGSCSVSGVCNVTPLDTEYAWRTSTGQIPINPTVVEECVKERVPSPSPWMTREPAGVCVNAQIVVRFSTKIDPKTLTKTSFLVGKCTAVKGDPCSTTTPVEPREGFPALSAADDSSDLVVFRPKTDDGLWSVSSTFKIILTTAIRSTSDVPMKEKTETCGKGNGYCFTFKTKPTKERCAVGMVTVTPSPFTAKNVREEINYTAMPRATDICVALDGSSMDWQWNTERDGGIDGRATITNNKSGADPYYGLEKQRGTALAETYNDPVHINADAVGDQNQKTRGTGLLSIAFIPPRVEAYGPNCDQACLNAAIWVRFNVAMDPIDKDKIVVKKCTSQNCRAFVPAQGIDLSDMVATLKVAPGDDVKGPKRYLVLDGNKTLFQPGAFYKVIIRGGANGVRSTNQLGLVEKNDPEGFAWTFRVKQGENARCGVASVDVQPVEQFESVVGNRTAFNAAPIAAPDACSKEGQPLISDQTFAWSIARPSVAKFINATGNGLIDTSSKLPAHCNQRCLQSGSDGVVGMVADCGNGLVETTDARYCVNGKTASGHDCIILRKGARGAEECDFGPGKNVAGSLCSASCLWNPARSMKVGGTCGNGTIDQGEQCDPGRLCAAGEKIGTDCTSDASVCGASGTCETRERFGCSDQCQAMGAKVGGSTCGNNDPRGDGKTCDDGNQNAGDGCSTDCLHEGSVSVTAICGDGVLQPGEVCENLNDQSCDRVGTTTVCKPSGKTWPIGCKPEVCLHTGLNACEKPTDNNCCGNGNAAEAGKECDGGEGCTDRCLLAGSSFSYSAPSICGDGLPVGIGEQCEAIKNGDTLIDATQLAEVLASQDAPDDKGRIKTALEATVETKKGDAVYGLQCGYTDESSCPKDYGNPQRDYGLTPNGCCAVRPKIAYPYPPHGDTNVCRNILISATFETAMNADAFKDNFIIAKEYKDSCPEGAKIVQRIAYNGFFDRVWHKVTSLFGVETASASVWCTGVVKGQIEVRPFTDNAIKNGSKVSFILDEALAAGTKYRVIFRADPNIAENKRRGILTVNGVAAQADPIDQEAGFFSWSFTTGEDICTISQIDIQDLNLVHKYLFTKAQEVHAFEAVAISLRDGSPVPITPVKEYAWTWQNWNASDLKVFSLSKTKHQEAISHADVTAVGVNGSALIYASVEIVKDTVSKVSTEKRTVASSVPVTAMLCENPWPSMELAPYRDTANSPSLEALAPIFKDAPKYNFSTLYCLDGTPNHPLPYQALHIQGIPLTTSDSQQGILRQYLFTYADEKLKSDGIGIRILSNPLHLSPAAWYAARGFTGKPEATTVDGYEAVRDGTTVYVAGVTTEDEESAEAKINSIIYLISHNPDASVDTLRIYRQLLENWSFNINITDGSQNVCQDARNLQIVDANGASISCTADFECAKVAEGLHCASFKAKLGRDTKRIADIQLMTSRLENAASLKTSGKYPVLTGGSYLQTISNSRWESWQTTLASAIDNAPLPQDPINRFLTCGRCSKSTMPCTADNECAQGETCVAQDKDKDTLNDTGFEPGTCWNATRRIYHCPSLNPADQSTVSRIYQYRAVDGGQRYELAMALEGPAADRYQPPLLREVYACSNTDQMCDPAHNKDDKNPGAGNSDCTYVDQNRKTVTGTCNPTGGRWLYSPNDGAFCSGQSYGDGKDADVCGNGVIGNNELCEVGDEKLVDCEVNGVKGKKMQICNDCRAFADNGASRCVVDATCGNGRIDAYQCTGAGFKYGQSCNPARVTYQCTGGGKRTGQACDQKQADADCKDASDPQNTVMKCSEAGLDCKDNRDPKNVLMTCSKLEQTEACDEGALNGLYGHCNKTCDKIFAYCGDSKLSIGETCDNGTKEDPNNRNGKNGAYCGINCSIKKSCSEDCRTVAPYCGDKIVQPPDEACDGNLEQTDKAICVGGSKAGLPCSAKEDCDGGVCGGSICIGGNKAGQTCADDAGCNNDNGNGVTFCFTGRYDSCKGVVKGLCSGLDDGAACKVDSDCPNRCTEADRKNPNRPDCA
ncbi:MAG: IPT/TIG domain-containing protein, partial [bacterium]|nr:IPT/TIG domain-containing protein [bacterium]